MARKLFVLVSLACFTPFVWQGWRDYRAFHVYEEGRCTVTNLGSYSTIGNRPQGSSSSSPEPRRNHPELMYRVQAAGATYYTFGFDNMNGRLSDMSEAGEFRVGETYPCWYDPKSPESAIIKRTFRPIFYAGALIPGFMLLVSVGMLRAASRAPRKRRRASGELKPDFTAAGRVKLGVVLLVVWIPIALGGAWLLLRSQHDLWFLSLVLVLSVIGLVRRFVLYWRCRHLADPRVEVDGTRAHVTIVVPSPLRKLTIELVKDEGRKMLHEAEQIAGPVEQWLNVAGGSSLVVTQNAGYGDIETEFALH